MYNVLEVARFIINYSNEKDYRISNLKLQKLLYFVQAYYASTYNKPCFKEKIIAWDIGPVVLEAYREYKQFGGMSIPKIKTYIEYNNKNFWKSKILDDKENLNETDKQVIKQLVDEFSNFSAIALTDLSRRQTPWLNAYKNKKEEISLESLYSYFS